MKRGIVDFLFRLVKNETFIWCTNSIGILAIATALILPRVITIYTAEDAARAHAAVLGWRSVTWLHCDGANPDGLTSCHLFGVAADGTDVAMTLRCDHTPAFHRDPGRCTTISS